MEKHICPVCAAEFYKKNYKKSQSIYCSQVCAYKGRALGYSKRIVRKPYNCKRKEPKICQICQVEYIYTNKRQKYCSRKCFEFAHKDNMRGANNPSYVNGDSYNKRSYRGDDWDTLRQEIYERDNYTCRRCGIKCVGRRDYEKGGGLIQCHHIISYKSDKNNQKSNLITLCLECHIKEHNRKVI